MQDKKDFGKYIADKRREQGLTQEELANQLYVVSTTVSKWERGITYPDITVITNLCKALKISEHEFFMACDDVAMNKEKKEAMKYRKLIKVTNFLLLSSYLIALVVCFICNLVINRTLSWFYIVFVSILISFTITSLPRYMKKDRYRILKVSLIFTGLIYLLLFVCASVTKGNWFYSSSLIATFELALMWIGIVIFQFTKVKMDIKISVVLLLLSISTFLTNSICSYVLDIPANNDNIYNNIVSFILVLSSCVIWIKNIIEKTMR